MMNFLPSEFQFGLKPVALLEDMAQGYLQQVATIDLTGALMTQPRARGPAVRTLLRQVSQEILQIIAQRRGFEEDELVFMLRKERARLNALQRAEEIAAMAETIEPAEEAA